jgi:hypothetical protein
MVKREYPVTQCGEFARRLCAREVTDAAQAGLTDEVVGGGRDSDRCVKCIKEKVVDGSGIICALSAVGQLCSGSEKGKSKEETLMCETQLKKRCSKFVAHGPKCTECVKAHIGTIDGALAGEGMCSKFQINHFCYFYGGGRTSSSEVS